VVSCKTKTSGLEKGRSKTGDEGAGLGGPGRTKSTRVLTWQTVSGSWGGDHASQGVGRILRRGSRQAGTRDGVRQKIHDAEGTEVKKSMDWEKKVDRRLQKKELNEGRKQEGERQLCGYLCSYSFVLVGDLSFAAGSKSV